MRPVAPCYSGAGHLNARSSSPRASSSSYGDGRQYAGERDGRTPNKSSGISESVSQAADSARQYASDVGKTVTDTASNYASAVGDYAADAGRTIVDQSEQFVEQARTTVQGTINRILQDQPLAVALAGLAAGAAVAAAFPATSAERRTLGAAGEQLAKAASSVGENLSDAASKAGEKLMNVAEERGLNAEGLKEVASDVAGAFGTALSGEKSDKQSSVSERSRTSFWIDLATKWQHGEHELRPGWPSRHAWYQQHRPELSTTAIRSVVCSQVAQADQVRAPAKAVANPTGLRNPAPRNSLSQRAVETTHAS